MSKGAENTTKRAYLVKIAGSMGSIYDFSNVHIYDEQKLQEKCKSYGASSHSIEYAYYDARIRFHKWHVLDEKNRHLFWLLSPTEENAFLSEWDVREEGM